MSAYKDVYSVTFGDMSENHVGMQKIGKPIKFGFNDSDIDLIADVCQQHNVQHEIYDLKTLLPNRLSANVTQEFCKVLVSPLGRDGVSWLLNNDVGADLLYKELKPLKVDKKALMRGQVKNKNIRWNSCFWDEDQEADYEKGKGTVHSFNKVPLLKEVREKLPLLFGSDVAGFPAELNHYYDIKQTAILSHGDAERRVVICCRLGASMPLFFRWYHKFSAVSEKMTINLNHGDMYCMGDYAVGYNWTRREKNSLYTLRHSAGLESVLKQKKDKNTVLETVLEN